MHLAKGMDVYYFYNLLMLSAILLLMPVWVPLVMFREKYRQTFFQRAFMPSLPRQDSAVGRAGHPSIWIHALSVGEVLSAEPLVRALASRYGARQLIFTATTRTGFDTACRVIASHAGAISHFPFDAHFSVKRALQVVRPACVIIVETDIWPNFLTLLNRRRIPVFLVNARLSDRSFRSYRQLRFLVKPLLARFTRICVQTAGDRDRFRSLGVAAEKLFVAGNMKFDQPAVTTSAGEMQRLREKFGVNPETSVWVAGSTHPGEEEFLAKAFLKIATLPLPLVLIVAPRDPVRADAVAGIFRQSVAAAETLTQIEKRSRTAPVVIVDRIGMLRNLYALADIAFVGGSLVNAGGHNPLEPASVARPVLFGPFTTDFRWVCQALEKAGGAVRVDSIETLAENVAGLIRDPHRRATMGYRAQSFFKRHRGAVGRTLACIKPSSVEGSQPCAE